MKGKLTTKYRADVTRKDRLEGKGLEYMSKADLQKLKKDLTNSLSLVNNALSK